MTTKYQDTDMIELPFERWLKAVDRKVVGTCGLSIEDLPDANFQDFYPGEKASFGDYKDAVKDCADHVIRYAGGSMLLQEEEDTYE